ncbi:hypothetical protein SAMN05421504_105715 [Amycolatopsis xylanica]|uniref:Uncharacterized protein n=1 Tax=Amycolatopsis xylanica TaxID=589385 RepID=A0A1H3KAI0_9PSEU|nr:hypothetical protein [Amycolatopsis xylanica]SDY49196.1 hypothetical protein SAMN05421504_105715 [Amycolatopsis xylanica]
MTSAVRDVSCWARPNLVRAAARSLSGSDFWFYSGTVGGASIEEVAHRKAAAARGVTLMIMVWSVFDGHPLVTPDPDDWSDASNRWWWIASKVFSQEASGTAYIVIGDEQRSINTWTTIECPTLIQNPKVREIVQVPWQEVGEIPVSETIWRPGWPDPSKS